MLRKYWVTISIGVVIGVYLVLMFIYGSETPAEERNRQEAFRVDRRQTVANEIVDAIEYFKDPRTGQCFAYYWGGADNGGPALARVPCDSIPVDLLTVAQLPPEVK